MQKKMSKQLDFAPRLHSYSLRNQMKKTTPGRLGWLVLASLWLGHAAAVAQENFFGNAPTNNPESLTNYFQPQPFGPTMPGSGLFGAPYMGTSALAGSASSQSSYVPTGTGLASWGPISVYPHLLYSLTYGNGLEAEPGTNSTTWVNTVSPGVLFKLGNHWTLDYTPTVAFYSNPLFRDTTGHSVILTGGTIYGDWALSLSQSYLDTTQPLIETGTQVEQEAYATAINAAWQMNGKLALQLAVNQNFRFAEEMGFSNLREWTTADWLNYQFLPQFGAALGVTGGYDAVSLGSDMPFEQGLARIVFQPGSKLRLTVMAGAEDRQFVHPSAPSLLEPIFNASAFYQVCEGTAVTLSASRSVTPSFYGNEVNVISGVTGDIRQHIVRNLYFGISGGYSTEPFTSIEAAPLPPFFAGNPTRTPLAVTRNDTRTFAQFRLSTTFRTHLTGSIFYMISDNASSQANFNYSGNQVGLELSYRY
jgi:hypothetical protein